MAPPAARLSLVLLTLALCALPYAAAVEGVDFSKEICESTDVSTFQCLVGEGYSFAIIQTWQGGYGITSNIVDAINNAYAAGMAHVDVYIFMCPNCDGNGDPVAVVDAVINDLSGAPYGMIWFDVEQCSGCWSDAGTNAQYLANAVNHAISRGIHVGIYSSEYEWSATVGGFTGFSSLPQWYAHYDDNPSFSDTWAYSYGGWTSPNIKQFTDTGDSCGIQFDISWYPDSLIARRNAALAKPQTPIDIAALRAFYAPVSKP